MKCSICFYMDGVELGKKVDRKMDGAKTDDSVVSRFTVCSCGHY